MGFSVGFDPFIHKKSGQVIQPVTKALDCPQRRLKKCPRRKTARASHLNPSLYQNVQILATEEKPMRFQYVLGQRYVFQFTIQNSQLFYLGGSFHKGSSDHDRRKHRNIRSRPVKNAALRKPFLSVMHGRRVSGGQLRYHRSGTKTAKPALLRTGF